MEATQETPARMKDAANVLFNERRYVEALRMYDRALDIDRAYLPAIYNKAMTLMKLDLVDEACFAIDKGLAFHAGDERLVKLREKCVASMNGADGSSFFHAKGESLLRLGKHDDSIIAFDRAIALDSGFQRALVGKARALEQLGRLDESLQALDRALALGADPKAAELRARVDRNLSKRRLKAREPANAFAVGMKHLGDALFRDGKTLQAISKYDVALDREPGYVAAWFNKGQAFRRLKNHAEAKKCLDKARELDPENELVGQALEVLALEIGEAQHIEASFRESEQVYEDALSKISMMLERTKDIDKDYDRITGMIHEAEGAIEAGSKYADMEGPRKLVKGALKMLSEDDYEKAEKYADGARKKALASAQEGRGKHELATREIGAVERTVREMMDAGVGIPQVRELQDRAEEEVFRKNFDEALALAKKAHKLALEEAEKALVILKTTDKDYQLASARLAEADGALEEAKQYNVVGNLEQMHASAKKAFDEGDYISAEVYAKMVIEQAVDAVGSVRTGVQTVEAELKKVRDLMKEVEDAGVDLSHATIAIERAEGALGRGEVEEGGKYAHLAYTATMKIVEETLNEIKIEGGAYKDTLAVIRVTADALKKAAEVGDVAELEEALQEAYASLDEDNYLRAMNIATEILAAAEDYAKARREQRDAAMRKIVAVETAADRFKGQGINMTDVESVLDTARGRIDAKEYEAAMEVIEQANELAKRAAASALRRK